MAIELVTSDYALTTSSAPTLDLSGAEVGDIMVGALYCYNDGSPLNGPADWTTIWTINTASGTDRAGGAWYKVVEEGEDLTPSWGLYGVAKAVCAAVYRGAELDDMNWADTYWTGTYNGPAVTPSDDGRAFEVLTFGMQRTYNAGVSGYTNVVNQSANLGGPTVIARHQRKAFAAGAGAQTPQWTVGGGSQVRLLTSVVLLEAAGGGGGAAASGLMLGAG